MPQQSLIIKHYYKATLVNNVTNRRLILTTSYVTRCEVVSLTLRRKHSLGNQQIPVSKQKRVALGNHEINSLTLSQKRDILALDTDNNTLKFPTIWLRDNCQCPACFQRHSQSRTIDWGKFDFGVKPLSAKLVESELTIEWSDNHRSNFTLDWLIERSFTEEKRKLFRNKIYRFERTTWGADEFGKYLKKFDYKSVLNEDSTLLNWLESLTKYGVAIVTNVPAKNNSNKILTERVAFTRRTHYGEEFTVIAKDGTTNVAYLSSTLPLHTDLPYYHYAPGANLLHCLVQSQGKGGESQLADGFHVGNYLKLHEPESYKILTKTLVDWSDVGHENGDHFHSLHQAPVLCEDEFGDLVRVNFSQPQRDSHFNAPLEQVILWYEAVGLFTKLLYSPENNVTFKLAEGDILTFDNLRLVHGRSAYADTTGRERLLIGCYLDWDEIYSRIRVLRKQLKRSKETN
ncbi:gamma-butyrobetaine dioxygenase-like [Neodiprion virginianus]|uniref:gamma-butyrobetaine dioxygenase-like n=1 Tax=Neodiprion virginianus TaxID=2961670 RepID=UPI001EE6BE77|nr:gamma-butyrobetaine dioxygenase-like [Neodiprion virginianus]